MNTHANTRTHAHIGRVKEWEKNIPENNRSKGHGTKFIPYLNSRQYIIIERKTL